MEDEDGTKEVTKQPPKKRIRIESEGLIVRYGPIVALNSFSAKIPEGIVGLLGPNGAGKSTFIKAVLGLVDSDDGEIRIDGLDPMKDTTAVRDMVGYVPEHDCLIPSMNAVGLVSYMSQISGISAKDAIQRTHEVLDFVGIGEERYRLISSYSTGMKQKVKLAQAIVHDPKILFLDEPTNGMDPQGREEMLELIRKIGLSGKTILVSSHILREVERVSEHVIIINNGSLVKEGSMKALIRGDMDLKRMRFRAPKEEADRFLSAMEKWFEIVSRQDEEGQLTVIIKGEENGKKVFTLASELGIQIREYGPATLSLEDIFLEAFGEGD